jgi:hypothetical protein
MALTKEKQALVTKKNDHGLPFEINKSDIVKLVKGAWAKSFARVETNRNAVLHQGWGSKALNMNVLLHPEIVATKHLTSDNSSSTFNNPSSLLSPSELNISEGLAGTLVDRIVFESNREAATRGSNVAEITKKRKETAAKKLENHEKRCTAGLLASAGRFSLGVDVLERQRHSKEIEEEKRRQKELRAKDIYDALFVKVQAIRAKNLPADRWTTSELNTMIQWHKRPDDSAMPSKKAEKLARYYEICGRGEPVAPNISGLQPQEEHQEIPEPPPLPEPDLAAAADCDGRDADAVLLLMLAGKEGVSHVGDEFCQMEVV